ncbi:MAG: beta-ketoacyl-ACP synthase II [Planctomycetia bacterium]|nr:beta-ketoacyl-ACP synthase II [Planctomycetia bacterium]
MKRRVVITGIGAVTSLSCQVEDLWKRICAGESGVRRITAFDPSGFRCQVAGEIVNWSTDGYLPPKEARRIDRFAQFAMVAGTDAVKDAGIDFAREDSYRCGVILGSGIGGLGEIEQQHIKLMEKGPERVSAFTIPKLMVNAAGGQLSIQYKIRGPNTTVATACASATNGIGEALKMIQHGDTDVMITGGTESTITPLGLGAFAAMRALSGRNDDPTRASRPFEVNRDGFVMAEGAGILVIEDLEHARNRGARIYAELLGYGLSADAGHITQPDEEGSGAARAMRSAIRDAGLDPADIAYINAHGTSTPLGDLAETRAIKSVFGDAAKKVSISSTKSQLGHALGASGGIELVLTLLALRDNVIPPTINLDEPDPECDLDYTPHQSRERPIDFAMSNSFGFGGHNAVLVIGRMKD